MSKYNYGFAIIGYNNVEGIRRLLRSLDRVIIPEGDTLTLIFCLDKSDNGMITKIADEYVWTHGRKIVFQQKKRVGLRDNILCCGNMMNVYDLDAIAVFEDDIYMSPVTYMYMVSVLDYYKGEKNIAGISLYKHEININAKHPFVDYNDGGDTFFVQYAMSWGQIWTRESWNMFYKWYKDEKYKMLDYRYIPQNILSWRRSWLKYHIMYCIAENKFFVYPRVSLTTDFSDPGEHNTETNTTMQVPMILGRKNWKFNSFDKTYAKYDSFFENITLKEFLKINDLEVDLYGVKKINPDTKYILTRKKLPYKIVKRWGLRLRPIEANIFLDIPGDELYLYNVKINEKKMNTWKFIPYIEYDVKGQNVTTIPYFFFIMYSLMKKVSLKLKYISRQIKIWE